MVKSGISLAPVTNSSKRNTNERVPPLQREPEAHVAYLFRKLSRLLQATSKTPDEKSVHLLRTTIRRIQTLATSLGEAESKPVLKFNKALNGIFEKAGRVRDLDVQIAALKTISLDSVEEDKRVLNNALHRQRSKRSRKLVELIQEERTGRLRRRQRRAKALVMSCVTERKNNAEREVVNLPKEASGLLAKLHAGHFDTPTLHELRLEVKHLRYAAEAAGERGAEFVALLKPVQDAIGEWHDWVSLIDTADDVLGPLPGHPLMTVLRGKIRGRFHDAVVLLKPLEAKLTELLQSGKRIGPVLVTSNTRVAAASAS